ncbi:hypothetical protein [Clostridium botulinum]|uniref:hypothetical protein n=1 Tax=Clostridium botulinum TaxID=1491 RepID=UPI0005F8BB6C|nr:hypothetical protein [Clostridium botulinum]
MIDLKVKLTLSNYFNMPYKFNKLSKEFLERKKMIDEIKEYMTREEFEKNTEIDLANNIKLIEREVNGECYLESLKKYGEREILNFLRNMG